MYFIKVARESLDFSGLLHLSFIQLLTMYQIRAILYNMHVTICRVTLMSSNFAFGYDSLSRLSSLHKYIKLCHKLDLTLRNCLMKEAIQFKW